MKKSINKQSKTGSEKQSTVSGLHQAQDAMNRLRSLKQEHKNKMEVYGSKKHAAQDLQQSFEKLIENTNWEDKENRIPASPRAGKKYEELKIKVESAFQEVQQAENEVKSIEKEITELEKDLRNTEYDIPASEVLELQKRLKTASEKVGSLQRAIQAQEEIKTKASSSIPSMQEMDKQRENLLAKIALGDATGEELEDFDKRYAEELAVTRETKRRSESVVSSANQTIAGLRRCLAEAESELNELTVQKDSARYHYLRSEAEKTGEEYLEAAKALLEKYERILGLEYLMRAFTKNPKIRTVSCTDLKIPMFSLRAFNERLEKHPDCLLPEAEAASESYSVLAASKAEKERMTELGIDWD